MENPDELAKRFREVFLNGKWIANTNYQDLLSHVSFSQSTKKIGSLNTISQLTQHINYYIAGILNLFEGGSLDIRDKYSFDFQPPETKEQWENMIATLISNSENFGNYVDQMSDKQLEQSFVDKKYGTYRRNIEAMIEHGYYHLGQISLIKKMILEM